MIKFLEKLLTSLSKPTLNDDIELILAAALQYIGMPYIWGGSGPNGFDCSGFVREALYATRIFGDEDRSAQAMHDILVNSGAIHAKSRGALAFYGKDEKSINHVMLLLSPTIAIGATGGDSTTKTLDDAIKKAAFVKLKHIDYRKDLVTVLLPRYL